MSGDRAGVPRRAGHPPEAKYFTGLWKPLGFRAVALSLPGLSIRVDGMDDPWADAFLARYAPYGRDTTTDRGAFDLILSASRERRPGSEDFYIEPPQAGVVEYNPVFVTAEPDESAPGQHFNVRACTYRLAAAFTSAGGRGMLVFARSEREEVDPRERAVENILRVATAWLALTRGGLLIHGASIVKDGRAYLFFGQSGSGKSTLAAGTTRGQVVTDDLTLLLPDTAGRLDVVGAPFRGTYTGGMPVTGRFPLKAAFRLRKAEPGDPPSVEPLETAHATAEAIANLPFVVDQLANHPRLFETVERALALFPIRALRFRKDDDSWWTAVEGSSALER